MQPPLAAPRDLYDTGVLANLARLEAETDDRPVAVVVGGLHQQPAGVRWAGLGDLPLGALIVRGVLARHHAEEPGQQRGLCEAVKVGVSSPFGGESERE